MKPARERGKSPRPKRGCGRSGVIRKILRLVLREDEKLNFEPPTHGRVCLVEAIDESIYYETES
jgi:hypothetical protein